MPEKQFTLDTGDGHKIHGVLNRAKGKKNKKAVLFIHGLPGDCHGYVPSIMAQQFPVLGYDVIRIDLYSWKEKGRSITDVTLKTHGQDIDVVVKHFSEKYDQIFGIGHSYGGPSLILSDQTKFSAFSLWDPSYQPSIVVPPYYKKQGDVYISRKGKGALIGEPLFLESKKMNKRWAKKQSENAKCPIQVVYAGRDDFSFWIKKGASFHTYAPTKTDEKVIKKAGHCFYEEGVPDILFRHTLNWFNKF